MKFLQKILYPNNLNNIIVLRLRKLVKIKVVSLLLTLKFFFKCSLTSIGYIGEMKYLKLDQRL